MSIKDIATSTEVKWFVYTAAAAAVVKGVWDYIKITREQNQTSGALKVLESPNLVEARARTAAVMEKLHRNHPSSTL